MVFLLSTQNAIQYLVDADLCSSEEVASAFFESPEDGKNFNLLVSLPGNRKLLVKQERFSQNDETANEFFNEWRFHQFLQQFPEMGSISAFVSQLLYFDESNSILVYNYLTDYIDLASFYDHKQVFPIALATGLGNALAALHRVTFNCQEYRDFIAQDPAGQLCYADDNPVQGLGRIGPEIFGLVTTEALKYFVLYQRYESLSAAIANLATHWHPCCLTHNDLRLNNVLVHMAWEQLEGGTLRLIDWERCNWGDPALDLGTLVASYLAIWLRSLPVDSAIALEESLRLAAIPLEAIQPSILAIAQAYLNAFPSILDYRPDFLQRAMQFAGLALIDKIEATIQYQKYFDNRGICMLQVAKNLLCRPQQLIPTVFGIPESELIPLSATLP
jgi:Phosphotransferase enzyme family